MADMGTPWGRLAIHRLPGTSFRWKVTSVKNADAAHESRVRLQNRSEHLQICRMVEPLKARRQAAERLDPHRGVRRQARAPVAAQRCEKKRGAKGEIESLRD